MNDRAQFAGFLSKFAACYRSVEVRAICGRSKDDDRWLNVWTRIEYRPEAPESVQLASDLPDTGAIKCLHAALPFETGQAVEVLDSIEQGRLDLGGAEVVYSADRDQEKKGQPLTGYHYYPRDYVLHGAALSGSWGRARLKGDGSNVSGRYKLDSTALDLHLRALPAPYEDAKDLLTDFGRYDARFRDSPRGEVVALAPIVLGFGTRQCLRKQVKIEVHGADTFTSLPMRIGVVERLLDGSTSRYPVDVPREGWKGKGTGRSVLVGIPVEEGAHIWLGLSACGVPVDAVQIQEPSQIKGSPRLAAHALFDPDFSRLHDLLTYVGSNARSLETGVTWLLHLCGMTAAHYGGADSRTEIDVVAFADDPPVAVAVECSTSPTAVDEKLTRLVLRSNQLERELRNLEVQPVLFLSNPSCHIREEDKKEASRAGVALITADDVFELTSLARRGTSAEQVLDYVRGRIPQDLTGYGLPYRW